MTASEDAGLEQAVAGGGQGIERRAVGLVPRPASAVPFPQLNAVHLSR